MPFSSDGEALSDSKHWLLFQRTRFWHLWWLMLGHRTELRYRALPLTFEVCTMDRLWDNHCLQLWITVEPTRLQQITLNLGHTAFWSVLVGHKRKWIKRNINRDLWGVGRGCREVEVEMDCTHGIYVCQIHMYEANTLSLPRCWDSHS